MFDTDHSISQSKLAAFVMVVYRVSKNGSGCVIFRGYPIVWLLNRKQEESNHCGGTSKNRHTRTENTLLRHTLTNPTPLGDCIRDPGSRQPPPLRPGLSTLRPWQPERLYRGPLHFPFSLGPGHNLLVT